MPQTRIFLNGDSTTYGYGDPEYGGWGNRLKAHMMRRAALGEVPAREVINLAVSSQAADQIVDRFTPIAKAYRRLPNISIFMMGLVDAEVPARQESPRVKLTCFESCLRRLGDVCINTQAQPLFVGYYAVDEKLTNPWKNGARFVNEDMDKYRAAMAQYSDKEGFKYVDLSALKEPVEVSGDGIHPTPQGHQRIFEAVIPVINDLIQAS